VGLRDMEDGCAPGHLAAPGFLAVVRVGRFVALVLRRYPSRHLDAMLAAPNLSAKRSPCVIGENVFARANVGFRDSLFDEAREDGRPIGQRLTAGGAGQGFGLHFVSCGRRHDSFSKHVRNVGETSPERPGYWSVSSSSRTKAPSSCMTMSTTSQQQRIGSWSNSTG